MENTLDNKELRARAEKIFFSSGELVELKHDIPHKPRMVVQTIDKLPMKEGDRVALLGVTCIWFSADLKLQKSRFSTKDIVKIKGHD